MNDFLLELGKNPQARKLIQGIGLPIPMPQELDRARGPSVERPLQDKKIAVGAPSASSVANALAATLGRAGAEPHVYGGGIEAFVEPGEAYGRRPQTLELQGTSKFAGLVLDATAMKEPADLQAVYAFFHPLVRRVERCGRVVVIGRPTDGLKPTAAATQFALHGFVRSLAKELGRRGATAQLIELEPGAEPRLNGVLRFLLSERSAYISGQALAVTAVADSVTAVADSVTAVPDSVTPGAGGVSDRTGKGPSWTAPLEGKVALVTGAARGIGAATSRLLASEGAQVICLDRPADDGPTSQLAREIDGKPLLLDVTDAATPDAIADYLTRETDGVDIVVHNAGITRDRTIAKMKPELWDQVLDVNLGAVSRITDALVGGVLNGGGRLICLSSIAGIAGNMGQTNYAASKAGIIGLVRGLSIQLAGSGITANAIAPGFIETRLTAAIPFAIREAARRMNNMGQGGRPIDVAEAINFLASPGAQGVTGQVLRVCGGSLVGA